MQYTTTLVGLAISAASLAQAQAPPAVTAVAGTTLKVTVGANGKLAYNPSNIVAPVGAQIEFDFFPKNHTVTQSSFADPCHPLSTGGFFSGFVPTSISPSGTTFTITVTDSNPIWFYCSQTTGHHCQSGMVGAINAPTTGKTLEAFIGLAQNASTSTFPSGGPAGGVLVASSNGTSSTGSSATGSASSSATSTAATGGSTTTPVVTLTTTSAASGSTSTSTGAPTTNAASVSGVSAAMVGVVAVAFAALVMG